MGARKMPSPMLGYTGGSSDANALAEIYVAMDTLCIQNQTLEDNFHNIQQRQYEDNL